MDNRITIFKNAFENKQPFYIEISKVLERIKNGKSKALVEEIRNESNKEKRASLKVQLPCILFSGEFSTRKDSDLIKHSGFVCLDFDDVEDPEAKKKELSKDSLMYAIFISPSGNGLKALVKIKDTSKHRQHYEKLIELYPELDISCCNEARVCFESYDPKLYLNINSSILSDFTAKDKINYNQIKNNVSKALILDDDKITKLLTWLDNKGDQFGSGSRNHWIFKFASSLCRFGVSETKAINFCIASFEEADFKRSEIERTIKSSYRSNAFNSEEFTEEIFESTYRQEKVSNQKINLKDDDYSFLCDEDEIDDYLEESFKGTLKQGMTTGIPELDNHFLFKDSSLVVINGFDNVGKTASMIYLATLSAMYNDWKWVVFSAENKEGQMAKMIEQFYHGKIYPELNQMELEESKAWRKKHFRFIKAQSELYDYIDITNMSTKAQKIFPHNSVLIDPYNSLSVNDGNEYSWNKKVITAWKNFTKKSGTSVYLNCHVISGKNRILAGEKALTAPHKGDTEGGAIFQNKADDFITIHRDVFNPDPDLRKVLEIHIRKIKDTETGGRVTSFEQPVQLVSSGAINGKGWSVLAYTSMSGTDASLNWRKKQKPKQSEIKMTPNMDFASDLDNTDQVGDCPF